MSTDKYLYDIVEDYTMSSSETEKAEIWKDFCALLWADDNKRRVYTRSIHFTVKPNLRDTDAGQLFNAWSSVTYKGCKSISRETNWCSLLRQKINNLYTRYFDKEVILSKDYMDMLKTPKKLYLKWIAGEPMTTEEIASTLYAASEKASELRFFYQMQKIELSWTDYKKLIEGFLKKILDNCKSIDLYEPEKAYNSIYDFINEDNFYVRYFSKCLTGYLLKWQKQYYHISDHRKYKRCRLCGALIENTGNRRMYCAPCAKRKMAADARLRKHRQRSQNVTK